jgi:outer membrane usher protein
MIMRLSCVLAIVLALGLTSKHVWAADQTLLLEVHVNGRSISEIGEFIFRNGALFVRPDELRDLGFRTPASLVPASDGLVSLTGISGLTWRLDQGGQALYVTAADERLTPTLLLLGNGFSGKRTVESGTGVTLNYDVNGVSDTHQATGSGALDLRLFTPHGVFSSGLLAYANSGPGGLGAYSAIRLDSVYTFSDPKALRRYRVGDFITGSLGWTRPVRIGGFQISSDFSLRPDLITFPVPSVSGSVAVPSTLDVMANGIKLFSRQIDAGPFEIPQLPVVTGAGAISMTVTNALGRQIVTTLPFYASSSLLASGLQTFSAQMGGVRRNWGLVSNDYGGLAATATYRRGLSQTLTGEATMEAAGGLIMAGAGGVVDLNNIAIMNVALAASGGSSHAGAQLSMGLQRIASIVNLGFSATITTPGFRDLAAVNGDPTPRLQLNANAGVFLGRRGSLGLAYTGIDRGPAPSISDLNAALVSVPSANVSLAGLDYLQAPEHAHIFSASYTVQIRNVSLYATAFRDFSTRNSSGLLFGLTIPLGARSAVSGSMGSAPVSGSYEQVQVSRTPTEIGDWGYQLFAATNPGHEFGQFQYKSPWALLSAGVDHIDQENSLRLEAQGSASFADGGLFMANTIVDSFAVVDTNGLANVHVLRENRDIGRTDSTGRFLVPDLRSFDINRIAIEPNDIPPDASIAFVTRDVRPQDRSGVVIKFPVQISHGALLRLVDEAGVPIPVGSTATLQATRTVVPVGYNGEAYVVGLSLHNQLSIEGPNGRRCKAGFDYHAVPGDIPTIGPVRCQEQFQ